jgi:hypothetical protein
MADEEGVEEETSEDVTEEAPKGRSGGKNKLVIIGVAALLLLGGGGAFMMMSGSDPPPPAMVDGVPIKAAGPVAVVEPPEDPDSPLIGMTFVEMFEEKDREDLAAAVTAATLEDGKRTPLIARLAGGRRETFPVVL